MVWTKRWPKRKENVVWSDRCQQLLQGLVDLLSIPLSTTPVQIPLLTALSTAMLTALSPTLLLLIPLPLIPLPLTPVAVVCDNQATSRERPCFKLANFNTRDVNIAA